MVKLVRNLPSNAGDGGSIPSGEPGATMPAQCN